MLHFIRIFLVLLTCLSFSAAKTADQRDSLLVHQLLEWNRTVLKIAEQEDKFLTLKGLRTTTMMHIAVHDALNSIKPRYAVYALQSSEPSANPMAALNYAAFSIALSQFPAQEAVFRRLVKKSGQETTNKKSIRLAQQLGEKSADAILKLRQSDGWNTEAEYQWHPMAPGVYAEFHEHSGTPEGFIFGAGWANGKPFMLPSADHFRCPPPPAITSEQYARAFNEVKSVGGHKSRTRTEDQAHLAMWWKDFVENSHNRLARRLIPQSGLDVWQAAQLLALLNMGIYDAYVSSFNNKFHYNHWRPYTAIRWADNDDNPHTEVDKDWNNLHQHTYAFPSYPSAHGTASAAAFAAFIQALGDNYSFVMETRQVDKAGPFSDKMDMVPPTRSFERFSDAGLEASMSRLYLGIHFRYDSVEGNNLGRQIGEYGVENFLQPLSK